MEKTYILNQQIVLRNVDICMKRVKLESYLTSYFLKNAKWIQDLKMRPETIKLLEENMGESSLSLVLAKFWVVFCFCFCCCCSFVFNLTAETLGRKTKKSWITSS